MQNFKIAEVQKFKTAKFCGNAELIPKVKVPSNDAIEFDSL